MYLLVDQPFNYLVSSEYETVARNADGSIKINSVILQPFKVFKSTEIDVHQTALTNQTNKLIIMLNKFMTLS